MKTYRKLQEQKKQLQEDLILNRGKEILQYYIQGQIDRLNIIMPDIFKMEEKLKLLQSENERV